VIYTIFAHLPDDALSIDPRLTPSGRLVYFILTITVSGSFLPRLKIDQSLFGFRWKSMSRVAKNKYFYGWSLLTLGSGHYLWGGGVGKWEGANKVLPL
jgi:hypothetical protein